MADKFGLQLFSYNSSYEKLFNRVFQDLKCFTPNRQYYEDTVDKWVRALENFELKEPHERIGETIYDILNEGHMSSKTMTQILKELDFDAFMDLKKDWLKQLSAEWLIQGHIDEDECVQMVKLAEDCLDSSFLKSDDCERLRIFKIMDRSVYNFEQYNKNEDSQNSGYFVLFRIGCDSDMKRTAIASVL